MVRLLSLALYFVGVAASAADLPSRIAEARAAFATPAGKEYEANLGPAIGQIMTVCVKLGSTDPESLGEFTLVAYVQDDGSLMAAQVTKSTRVADCFLAESKKITWPAPPRSSPSAPGFPIEVTMRVVP